MPNRGERRKAANRGSSGGDYRLPRGLDYNEFVGELGPSREGIHTELHVRYGVLDGVYYDWTISMIQRLGTLPDYRSNAKKQDTLERRVIQRIRVHRAAIVHERFDPDDPSRVLDSSIVVRLRSDDGVFVDHQYHLQMYQLSLAWDRANGTGVSRPVDPHTDATFKFASKNRDAGFRTGDFAWVRNTLVSLAADESEEIMFDRGGYYFAGRPATAGVLFPNGVIKFIRAVPGAQTTSTSDAASRDSSPLRVTGAATMGMLVDTVYTADNISNEVEDFLGGGAPGR